MREPDDVLTIILEEYYFSRVATCTSVSTKFVDLLSEARAITYSGRLHMYC